MIGLGSHLSAGTAALALALDGGGLSPRLLSKPAPEPLSSEVEVPGGYHDAMDLRGDDEPPDGDKHVTLGSVLFSLGLIQAGGAVGSYVTATPRYCSRVYGANVSDDTCAGLRIYGIVGIAFGALMTATGATFLGWGLIQRQRHRKWMKERGFTAGPMLGPGQHGVAFGFRF